jgi:anti-sigma regulatory factor (Ser/Thr protein kinase)
VFDPETGQMRVATAGHLPPIIVANGDASVVDLTPGAPLGGFPYGGCPEQELWLRTGDTIVLYTDGLVERRGIPLSQGMDELAAVVREARSPEHACQLAVERMVPAEGLEDDLAIVALCSTVVPEELHLELSADPDVLSRVRRHLRRWLRERGAVEPLISEVALAANEACANAIEHAYPPGPASFELDARTTGADEATEVVITVRDRGRWRPPRGESRGRGLTIIDGAMDSLDINPTPNGTEIVMRRRLGSQ